MGQVGDTSVIKVGFLAVGFGEGATGGSPACIHKALHDLEAAFGEDVRIAEQCQPLSGGQIGCVVARPPRRGRLFWCGGGFGVVGAANKKSDVDGQCPQRWIGVALGRHGLFDEFEEFSVFGEGCGNLVVHAKAVDEVVIVIATFGHKVALEYVRYLEELREFVDVVLVWVTEPQVGADRVCSLIGLDWMIPVFLC